MIRVRFVVPPRIIATTGFGDAPARSTPVPRRPLDWERGHFLAGGRRDGADTIPQRKAGTFGAATSAVWSPGFGQRPAIPPPD